MISFVIPTLNEIKSLESTLQNLTSYSGPHELIVSDGDSTDGTIELSGRYTDNVVVHKHPDRQTIAQARNMGAARASGDYIVFVDADVVVPDIDSFFATALTVFQRRPDVVALTVKYRVLPETRQWFDHWVFVMLGLQFWFQNNVLGVGGAGGEFQMIAAEAFTEVGGFDEHLVAAEDMDLFRRLSGMGRTHFERRLTVYHTARRAHQIGWPKLLWSWFLNSISVQFRHRSVSTQWEEVR